MAISPKPYSYPREDQFNSPRADTRTAKVDKIINYCFWIRDILPECCRECWNTSECFLMNRNTEMGISKGQVPHRLN